MYNSDIFRLAMTMGFFFNSARKLANSDTDYLMISDGNIVSLDPSSAFSLKENYPQCLIFTELSGTSVGNK